MTQVVFGPTGSRRRRRTLLVPLFVVALVALILTAGAQAVHDNGKFELDKNASNDLNVTALGELGANVTATATSIPVCRTAAVEPGTPFTILVQAERMRVTAAANGSFGGNCGGTKRSYTVTRAFDSTSGAAHSKGGVEGLVSLVVAASKDGPDWNQVYAVLQADPQSTCSSLGLVECEFVSDQIGPTTFTGGSTKDHLPISGWQHTSGSSPDKAEILNAYAAKAIQSDGDQILYFGMDRYAVDGSTDIGFWFFKNPVTTNPDGTFTGTHAGTLAAPGDILILGTFTQGGATTNIRVFRWVGSGGNESGSIQGPDADFSDCIQDPPLTNDSGCATVNDTTIEVPWTYTFKGSATGKWIPAGGMYEGGVNLTKIGLAGCFSSFLAETRSSPSITAILKDFALGSFEACQSALSTRPGAGDASGTLLTDGDTPPNGLPDTSVGTGSVSVKDRATLNITGIASWSGTLNFWLCGPTATTSTALCDGTTGNVGTPIGGAVSVNQGTTQPVLSPPATLTSVGRYCWRAEFTSGTPGVPSDKDSKATECFEVKPVTPTLSTTASTVVVGLNPISDSAMLGGTASQPGSPIIGGSPGAPAGGSITFRAYGPSDATCTGTPVFTSTPAVPVSGNATYGPVSFTPTALGTYRWVASYSGNSPNTNPKAGACNDTGETTQVVDANVSIAPSGVNEVGTAHTFTITTTAFPAGTTATLQSITPNVSPSTTLLNNTCGAPTLGTNTATCTFQVNSSSATTFTANATAVWSFSGLTGNVTRSTSGTSGPGGSGPATKRYVDANVSIAPSGVNEVGTAHTFTVTTNALPAGTTATLTSLTPNVTPSTTLLNNTCGTPTLGTNTATCSFQVNSSSATTFTANATAVWHFAGSGTPPSADVTRTTDGTHGSSNSATKRYVDANVSIAPSGVNEVGTAHTFTVTTNALPAGTTATLTSLTPNVTPSTTLLNNTCGAPTLGTNTATCTFQVNSSSATTFTANATAVWHFAGSGTPPSADVTRTTDGTHGSSNSATKRYVDANVSIAPDEQSNEVGTEHTFTITSEAFPAGTTATLTSITPSISPAHAITSNCDSPSTPAGEPNKRTCTVTINSDSAGTFTLNATAVWHFAGSGTPSSADVTRSTSGDSGPGGSGPAVKHYVDAWIMINPPEATNTVGDPHTVTITVKQDDGRAAGDPNGDGNDGFGPPPSTLVTVTLTNDATSDYATLDNQCGTVGTDANGTCTVTFTSPTAGTVTAHASVTLTVDGVELTRETDGEGFNSGDAVKHFVAGSVRWSKVDNAGALQGGATFELCRTNDYILPDGGIDPTLLNLPVCVTVADNGPNDEDPADGKYLVSGLALGRYTVTETVAPAGFVADPDTETVELTPGDTEQVIATAFVNSRPILKISGFGYTNEATGTPTAGVLSGSTTFTVDLHNYGTAAAVLTNSSLVVTSNETQGSVSCAPSSTLDLTGTIAANGGDGGPYSLTCTYTGLNDGAVITAMLNVKYTTNGLERTASGSPATISFTVQGD